MSICTVLQSAHLYCTSSVTFIFSFSIVLCNVHKVPSCATAKETVYHRVPPCAIARETLPQCRHVPRLGRLYHRVPPCATARETVYHRVPPSPQLGRLYHRVPPCATACFLFLGSFLTVVAVQRPSRRLHRRRLFFYTLAGTELLSQASLTARERELVSVLEIRIEPGDLNQRALTPQSVTLPTLPQAGLYQSP